MSESEPLRPPLGVAAVLLFARDPERLAQFYRERLAIPLRPVRVAGLPAHWATDVGRVYVSIWPADEGAASLGRAGIALHVANVAADFARLVAAGVPVDFPPRRTPLGIIARLRDPEGNVVELYETLPRG